MFIAALPPYKYVIEGICQECGRRTLDSGNQITCLSIPHQLGRQALKNGYYWAATPDGELFVLLNIDGRGFVPAVEDDINMAAVTILEPVTWPSQVTTAVRQEKQTPSNVLQFSTRTALAS